MPNWCENYMVVTGSPKILKDFAEKAKVIDKKDYNTDLSLANFMPMPKELEGSTAPCKDDKELKKKYGASNWYDWNIMNWGCKWDISAEVMVEKNKLSYTFMSPWAPPELGIRNISKLYPELKFVLKYEEPGMDFAGTFIVKGGKIIKNRTTNCPGGD